ncbi:hypothetical protein Taro_021652 [Colocasia esculenta]|uniref:Uncharacterized protein n=1 Tax=Colocasia esculenta TaxID=4460 RepID=A0A843UZE6_COLES|nr:hypothetical protein [Colocasia esculenta]
MSALVVGGTDTSRRTGPQLVLFQCLTLASLGQGLWRCQAWACDRVVCRWWCLVGLHSCLTFLRGAAAGPFVRGCETESRQTKISEMTDRRD